MFAISLLVPQNILATDGLSECQIGKEAADHFRSQYKVSTNKQVNEYVQNLGQKLVKNAPNRGFNYNFTVLDTNVENASALPCGFVFVNTGLIKKVNDESELVGVLAHEIAHAVKSHGMQNVRRTQKANRKLTAGRFGVAALGIGSRIASATGAGGVATVLGGAQSVGRLAYNGASLVTKGVLLKYGRDAEREADLMGAEIMHKAGWNPIGLANYFSRDRSALQVSALSTHPSSRERS
ncbi:MAG TPA: M48 family metalloprotease, partial [Vampirovibrionales bacterium]